MFQPIDSIIAPSWTTLARGFSKEENGFAN
jgi:hypothetical protein